MSLYPLQQKSLIKQPDVQLPVRLDLLARQEPPEADTVVKVDVNNVPPGHLDKLGAVPVVVGVGRIPTPLDEHHDGELGRLGCVARRPHVGEETVLAHVGVGRSIDAEADGAETRSILNLGLVLGCGRGSESQVTERRGGVSDAQVLVDAVGELFALVGCVAQID